MNGILISLAAEFTGKKAFKSADTATAKLEKSAMKLGKTLASVFAADQVIAFGKASVRAFMDDQKSAAILANTVKNLGLEFDGVRISNFIDQLSKASGVADDELRPAFQRLLQATGSVTKSQDLLSNAIDISKGASVGLDTVILDLANAYVGNNKGLKKYTLGLSAAELKTASFDKVLSAFNKNFAGANAAYLETYAGKMDVLTVAANEAQEVIGQGLVDAFISLAGQEGGVSSLAFEMENLSYQVANSFRGMANFYNNIKEGSGILAVLIKSIGWLNTHWINPYTISKYFAGKTPDMPATGGSVIDDYNAASDAAARRKERERIERDAAKRAKEYAALLAKQAKTQKELTAEQKKQAALKKAGAVMDMEQIQIVAALKGQLSEDDRKRVELQAALLNGNDALATKLTKEVLYATDATGKLYQYFQNVPTAKNPFEYLDTWLIEFQKKMDTLKFPVPVGVTGGNTGTGTGQGASVIDNYIPDTNYVPLPTAADVARLASPRGSGASTIGDYLNVVVKINEKEIASSVQNQNNSGNFTGFNRLGDFRTL